MSVNCEFQIHKEGRRIKWWTVMDEGGGSETVHQILYLCRENLMLLVGNEC